MIQEFSAMLKERLNAWKEKSSPKSYPKNILYFRDGVSESQYSQVRENEVNKINEVFTELKADSPRIMAITCTKRHHTRFYPRPGVNSDILDVRTGNTKPGKLFSLFTTFS
jgi:eukaryotic translation initiation factor 2C